MELDIRHRQAGHVRPVLHHQLYLDDQPVSFQRIRLSGAGSIRAGFYFRCGGRDRPEHSVYRRHFAQRTFFGWVLCGIPPAYHPDCWRVCGIYGAYQARDDKGRACGDEHGADLRAVRCADCLCAGLCETAERVFRGCQHSEFVRGDKDRPAGCGEQRCGQRGFDTGQPVFYSSKAAVAAPAIRGYGHGCDWCRPR